MMADSNPVIAGWDTETRNVIVQWADLAGFFTGLAVTD